MSQICLLHTRTFLPLPVQKKMYYRLLWPVFSLQVTTVRFSALVVLCHTPKQHMQLKFFLQFSAILPSGTSSSGCLSDSAIT